MRITLTLCCDGVAGLPGGADPVCANTLSTEWVGQPHETDTMALALIDIAMGTATHGWENRPIGTAEGEKVLTLCPTCKDALATWAATQLTSGED